MSACLLSLSVMSLLLPTAFHASFNDANTVNANKAVLAVSRGTSVVSVTWYGIWITTDLLDPAYRLWHVPLVSTQVPRLHVRKYTTAYHR